MPKEGGGAKKEKRGGSKAMGDCKSWKGLNGIAFK